jgi:hypothetical protein
MKAIALAIAMRLGLKFGVDWERLHASVDGFLAYRLRAMSKSIRKRKTPLLSTPSDFSFNKGNANGKFVSDEYNGERECK